MANSRIPFKNELFHSYVMDGNVYLKILVGAVTRGEYLGMTAAEMADLDTFATDVDNKYIANRNKSTKDEITAANYANVKKDFGNFFRPILDRIAANLAVITTEDRLHLNIADPDTVPTAPGVIDEQCICAVVQKGGGVVEAACKSEIDETRASTPDGADGVQIAMVLTEQPVAMEDPGMIEGIPELSGVPKYFEISGPTQCNNKEFFPGATFRVNLGPEASGKRIQFYVRWYNTKHSENAGPWSEKHTLNIW